MFKPPGVRVWEIFGDISPGYQVRFYFYTALPLSLSLSLRHGIAGRGEAMFGLVCVVHLGTPP